MVSVGMIKHYNQKRLGAGKSLFTLYVLITGHHYKSKSGTQGRNLAAGSKDHEGVLLTGFLPMACQPAVL